MIRLIARLDVKNDTVVKGVHFEGLRVVGNLFELAHAYYKQGADEILFEDVVASLYERNSILEIVRKSAADVFIPITVGGGLRTIKDIGDALQSGADKVSICTAALKRPDFLREAAETFGSQAIVLSVQAKRRQSTGYWEAFMEAGREPSGKDAVQWVHEAVKLGVGEVLLSSVDMDGTCSGYDIELISRVAQVCPVPLMVSGGAGNVEHIARVAEIPGVDAIVLASVLHYGKLSIGAAKESLANRGVDVRQIGYQT